MSVPKFAQEKITMKDMKELNRHEFAEKVIHFTKEEKSEIYQQRRLIRNRVFILLFFFMRGKKIKQLISQKFAQESEKRREEKIRNMKLERKRLRKELLDLGTLLKESASSIIISIFFS